MSCGCFSGEGRGVIPVCAYARERWGVLSVYHVATVRRVGGVPLMPMKGRVCVTERCVASPGGSAGPTEQARGVLGVA